MTLPVRTVAQLESDFLAYLLREAGGGRCSEATIRYYRTHLDAWVAAVGPGRSVEDIVAFDLERLKTSWHSVQTVQRLWNWAVGAGLVERSPFVKVQRPQLGQRERVLTRAELVRVLRAARPALRAVLLAMVHSLARPGEIRALRWSWLRDDGLVFILRDFKGRKRRRDTRAVRTVCVDRRLSRLIGRLKRKSKDDFQDLVFLNSQGRPWTANALRLAMRRACNRAGLVAGDGEEAIVCYTLRHTSATLATANGVQDRLLADLMGHSSTRTTARYQHLQPDHLADAIDQATRKRA